LIDYEKITDGSGQRLVRFGRFAGYAGMVDTLHAIGDRWLALGYSTPFLHLGYSYQYFSLDAAKDAVAALGEELATVGVPQEIGPVIFGFTSNGTSSQGAQEIFKLLPHKWIAPEDVAKLASSTGAPSYIHQHLLFTSSNACPTFKRLR
jgi:alpha-aminoadipic semialdehyde synthase